jgi:hypothetical protein
MTTGYLIWGGFSTNDSSEDRPMGALLKHFHNAARQLLPMCHTFRQTDWLQVPPTPASRGLLDCVFWKRPLGIKNELRGLQNKFAFTNWTGNVGLVFWLSFIQNLSTSVKEGLAIKLTDLSWNMSKAPLEIGELSIGLKISCWTCLKGSSVCSKAWGYFSAEVTYFIVMNLCNLWYPKQNTTNRLNRLARPHSANTQLSTFQSKLLFLFLRYLRLY